jgi:hypothetical protein
MNALMIATILLAAPGDRPRVPYAATSRPSVPAAIPTRTAEVAVPDAVSVGGYGAGAHLRTVAAVGSAQDIRTALASMGVTPGTPGPARAMPAGLFVGVPAADYATPRRIGRVVRFGDGSAAAAQYVLDHPGERFLVQLDAAGVTADALRAVAGPAVAAVVVGEYHGYFQTAAGIAEAAAETKEVLALLRQVTDAPVLLAVSRRNKWAPANAAAWTAAFDLEGFDGWAVFNLHNWAAILELGNARTNALTALGLPEKPTVLLDFQGTPSTVAQSRPDYIRAIWRAKAGRLLTTLKAQGWRGVSIYAPLTADASIKAGELDAAVER